MECNSIPGHPLGFSPSVSGLPNFGMLDRSLCSAVSAKKNQDSASGSSGILSLLWATHEFRRFYNPQRINICTSGGHHALRNLRDSVHSSFQFSIDFLPRVTKNHHDSQRTESELIERFQHLWKSVIKCPVTDQMAVALMFWGVSFCSVRRSSDKTENRQKGCCGKWQ